jgi:hypothetical protein
VSRWTAASFAGPLTLLEDVAAAATLSVALPRFLARPLTLEEAAAAQQHRLKTRDTSWLSAMRDTVYRHPRSPYRRLLDHAGCELGDLERLVRQEGLEGALRHLYEAGAYLTIEEFKGRRPIVRGSTRFSLARRDLRNPRAATHAFARSGGSRGMGMPVPIDLAFLREQSTNACLMVHARGGGGTWLKANWTVPGGGALIMILIAAGFGRLPSAWFSQLDPDAPTIPARYRASARWVCRLSGLVRRPIPRPRHVPLDDPDPILDWMTDALRQGEVPLLQTFTSSAVRLCEVATERGIDLHGVQFILGGEPVTAARLAPIGQAGAVGLAHYGSAETGSTMAYGCLAPSFPDDCHAMQDLFAFIQPEASSATSGLSRRALLITSLRGRSPLVLLNVSLGDEALLERRDCGCPFTERGWTTHLHSIRSFEKLTAGGMTFLDVDAIRVLEEDLPRRFGGGPAHYQLVEEEDAAGRSHLILRVHPAVGLLDDSLVADAFLRALGSGDDARHVMALSWRQAGLLRVERKAPVTTDTGKILHLHRRPPLPAGRERAMGNGTGHARE